MFLHFFKPNSQFFAKNRTNVALLHCNIPNAQNKNLKRKLYTGAIELILFPFLRPPSRWLSEYSCLVLLLFFTYVYDNLLINRKIIAFAGTQQ